MARFLVDFEVETHGCLSDGIQKICSAHPNGDWEVHISDLSVAHGADRPLLSMQIILGAEDHKTARELGTDALKEYLHYLSFVTNLTYRIHRLVQIVDWTPGLKQRACYQYQSFRDIPHSVINHDLIRSVEMLQRAELPAAFKRALKWFANGISSQYVDDQFQYFWLVLELIAQLRKDSVKVNDRCVVCGSPLYCESCKNYPVHRPYPKQAMAQFVHKIVRDEPAKFFEDGYAIRNAIMHGEDVEDVARSRGINLDELLDAAGRVAWHAIYVSFGTYFKTKPDDHLHHLMPSRYCHEHLSLAAHLIVSSSDPDNPKLSELPKTRITLVESRRSEIDSSVTQSKK